MAFAERKPWPLNRRKFSRGEMRAADAKNKILKNERKELQIALAEMSKISREDLAVLKAMLHRKGVKKRLGQLLARSLMLSENLQAAAGGRLPKHNIPPLEEGFLLTEIRVAASVVKEAKRKGIL